MLLNNRSYEFDEFIKAWSSENKHEFMKAVSIANKVDDVASLLKKLPKSEVTIKTIRPSINSLIVAVVPTIDSNSDRGKKVSNFFSPYPVIFVESSGPHFNYSHSCNEGIEVALKLNPTWIIISNDDIVPLDPFNDLVNSLSKAKGSLYTATDPSRKRRHGGSAFITKVNSFGLLFEVFQIILRRDFVSLQTLVSFGMKKNSYSTGDLDTFFPKLISHFGNHRSIEYKAFADFCVFKADILKRFRFDENFWNNYEDRELSFRLFKEGFELIILPFKLGSVGDVSFNGSLRRRLQNQINKIYFSSIMDKNLMAER